MVNILFQLTSGDESYLPLLKPFLIGRCNLYLSNSQPSAILEVAVTAKQKGCKVVATTNPKLLQMLLGKVGEKLPSLDDYAGSIIEKYGIEFLILNPVDHLVKVPYGRFLYERYFSKLIHPESWFDLPTFQWELFEPAKFDSILSQFRAASFISIDIETGLDDERRITCVGFTAVLFNTTEGNFTCSTVVVPAIDLYNIEVIRKLCSLRMPKVFQNGKYDNAYLLRYGICTNNWAFDTAHLFHSWYSELPKRLDFIASFTLRRWQYWKDESSTENLMEYYAYNAKDAFATAMIWIVLMQQVPKWALDNYLKEFPLVFPCMLAEMQGIKVDMVQMEKEAARFIISLDKQKLALGKMVGNTAFNPSSPKQVIKLFEVLGSSDIKNTKPASRDKVASRHPLNKRLMDAVEAYRKDRKIYTSYLRDYNPKTNRYLTWNNRMFFTENPHGTDTGRLASKISHFWCGTNITNQPRDRADIEVKSIYIADDGYLFGEADYEQAETRDTAYISGDLNLIAAVEDKTRDFHGINASKFFGVPYEKIINSYQDEDGTWIHKKLDKVLRDDIGKRIGHGANYNMQAQTLLDTMGMAMVMKARAALKLPKHWTGKQITQYLLNLYSTEYKIVKVDYYDKVKADIRNNRFLVGATGWHRYCFGNPSINKADLNAYVAHCPQSLNAMTLNIAYKKVFYEVWLPNSKPTINFKLGPQIHDSIKFQYRIGHEHLAREVKRCMEMTIPVTDVFGITRNLFVPVALKGGANRWSEIKSIK